MKKILSAALCLCFAITHSQITFEKGYFINNTGIKTECFIKNEDWRINPQSFLYKIQESDTDTKTENMMGVQEFGIENVSKYRRFKVNVDYSPVDVNKLSHDKNPKWVNETFFLKAVVTGDASLYVLTDGYSTKYFYETQIVPIEQLVYIKYMSSDGEGIAENKLYRQQLYNNVKCANTPESSFKDIEYKEKALVKHFELYNSCMTQTTAKNVNYAVKNADRKKFTMSFTPGIYSASMKISDPGTIYNVSTDVSKMIFKIAIEAEYILPFNKNTWSIFVNPGYQKFNVEKSFAKSDGFITSPSLLHHTVKVDYSSIEIPFGLRHYFFLNNSSRIFANIAYVIDLSQSGGKATFTNTENNINAGNDLEISSRNNLAFGVGYAYHRFSAELRINLAREVSSFVEWHAKYSTNGIKIGYQFL